MGPFVSSAPLLSLTVSFLLNSAAMLHPSLYFIAIFMLTALLNLLTACLQPLPRPRRTRLSTLSHPYAVQPPNARVNQYLHSFISSTGKLWNSLPLSVFPPSYDLNSFKREVSRHLSNSS